MKMVMREDPLRTYAEALCAGAPLPSISAWELGQRILLLLGENTVMADALVDVQVDRDLACQALQAHLAQADEQARWQAMVNTVFGLWHRHN
jgi:hypothetical protein